jgi:hypothetical protein
LPVAKPTPVGPEPGKHALAAHTAAISIVVVIVVFMEPSRLHVACQRHYDALRLNARRRMWKIAQNCAYADS